LIYLDSASQARPLPCALEAYNNAPFGNPSSGHLYGQKAREALEESRATIAECMHCKPSNVYFVSTATEGLAWALDSMYLAGVEVVLNQMEHHSVSENRKLIYSSVKHPICICRMLVNNEVGSINEKPEGYDYWLCDATAAVGHMKVDFDSDVLVADGLKFGGVPGAAFLLAKDNVPLTPMFRGGGQEHGMRAGTENVPAICAMAAALKWQCENMERNLLHVTRLRAEMLNRLKSVDYLVNAMGDTSPYILNVSFMGVENGALALMLSNRGVMVSTGAACTTGDNAPSHVLMAMYGDEDRARSAIRISFSHDTTEDEVKIAASEIVECVEMLRGMM
jgi:cysteine desulfurase